MERGLRKTPVTWDSFHEGDVYEFGDRLITKEKIIDFASVYVPQPFHLERFRFRLVHGKNNVIAR